MWNFRCLKCVERILAKNLSRSRLEIYTASHFFVCVLSKRNGPLHIYGFLLKDMGSEMFSRNRVSLSCLSCGVRSFRRSCTRNRKIMRWKIIRSIASANQCWALETRNSDKNRERKVWRWSKRALEARLKERANIWLRPRLKISVNKKEREKKRAERAWSVRGKRKYRHPDERRGILLPSKLVCHRVRLSQPALMIKIMSVLNALRWLKKNGVVNVTKK